MVLAVFCGILSQCQVTFTKFNESGTPVRATMDCQFQQVLNLHDDAQKSPFQSPDTTKYRMVTQGDALWAMALKEYGQADQWRLIASANGLTNPRRCAPANGCCCRPSINFFRTERRRMNWILQVIPIKTCKPSMPIL